MLDAMARGGLVLAKLTYTEHSWAHFHPDTQAELLRECTQEFREAFLAAMDEGDHGLIDEIGEAHRLGMREALDNLPDDHIGAINEHMKRSGARAVIRALRALAQEQTP